MTRYLSCCVTHAHTHTNAIHSNTATFPGQGQRVDIAEDRYFNVDESACTLNGVTSASGFRVAEYNEDYCTRVNCSKSYSLLFLDLGAPTTVGAVNINPVGAGSMRGRRELTVRPLYTTHARSYDAVRSGLARISIHISS